MHKTLSAAGQMKVLCCQSGRFPVARECREALSPAGSGALAAAKAHNQVKCPPTGDTLLSHTLQQYTDNR